MAITTGTSGIGTLTSVAWTPLDGTGLSPAQTASVSDEVEAATAVAKALLAAAHSAFNLGRSQFSLDDLAELGHLSALPTGDQTAGAWATFIGRALGSAPAADQARSFGEWRRLAGDLQHYAALQASRRDATWGVAGGVTHVNGQWYANGQALSLLDLFTAVRVNQVANHDDALDGFMSDLAANNRRLTAAREWMAMLRNPVSTYDPNGRYFRDDTAVYDGKVYQIHQFKGDLHERDGWFLGPRYVVGVPPTNTDYWKYLSQYQLTSATRTNFMAKWGFDPLPEFHKTAVTFNTPINEQNLDIYLTDIKSYIDVKDTDNQKLQQQALQKENRRNEVLEALTSFAGNQSKTGAIMAGNLA